MADIITYKGLNVWDTDPTADGSLRILQQNFKYISDFFATLASPTFTGTVSAAKYQGSTSTTTMAIGPSGGLSANQNTQSILLSGWIDAATAGSNQGVKIQTVTQQSSTAAYTDVLVNRTQTTVGSGAQLLLDLQVGGTSKFKVDNVGAVTAVGAVQGAHKSSDGTAGLTATCTTVSGDVFTVKNGLITAFTPGVGV